MREIKFRAWDGKTMDYDPSQCTDGPEITHLNSNIKAMFEDWHYPKYLSIMQSTGLYDKNGKEIYEGDIVTGNTSYEELRDEREWSRENPCIVMWSDMECGFSPFTLNARWRCDVVNVEVIGNIYQDPELLLQIKSSS